MRKNQNNLIILLVTGLIFALGCGNSSGSDSKNERKIERGRLKFVNRATSIHSDKTSIFRSVHSTFYVDGKEWSPEDDKDFAEKFDACDTSPNPQVEILRCFDDDTAYFLGMKDDKPRLLSTVVNDAGHWIDEDGRWLLFKKQYFNVETGEKIEVKGIPFADDKNSVFHLLAVSPDKKTIVVLSDIMPKTQGDDQVLTIQIIDAETGNVEKHIVSFTKNPWLTDYHQPIGEMTFPPITAKNLIWKKDANGRDKLEMPELFGKTETKKLNKRK